MKIKRDSKIPFYENIHKMERLREVASSLHKSTSWLYNDEVEKLDENVEIPETYFALNGGQRPTQVVARMTKDACDKVAKMATARRSVTGDAGTRAAIMRYVGDSILAKHANGEYKRGHIGFGCVQIVVTTSMHEKMVQLFPRKFIPEKNEWSGGVSRPIRKVIRGLKAEDFPKERVCELYKEFVAETGGLHRRLGENRETLAKQGLRPYAIAMYDEEHEIVDAIARGGYGAKAAVCYYAYKLAFERATQRKADSQNLKRGVQKEEIPHECGMELPGLGEEVKPQKVPENPQKELKKDVAVLKKDVGALKVDVGLLKNTQKQLIYSLKRLNERCFSKKKPVWWFHVLIVWTVVTVLITLGVISLIN